MCDLRFGDLTGRARLLLLGARGGRVLGGGGGGGGGGWREREVIDVVRCLDRRLGYVCFDDGFVSELENFRRRYVGCLSL